MIGSLNLVTFLEFSNKIKYLFSLIEKVVALIAGRKAMAPLILQMTMMARMTMTLVILNINKNMR